MLVVAVVVVLGYRASTGVNLINDFYNCYVDVLVASGGRAPRHVGGWGGR